MAADTLESLGLGTVETRPAEAAPYQAYWSDTYPAALAELGFDDPAGIAALRHFGKFAVELTTTVVRGNEPESLNGDSPRYLMGPPRTYNTYDALHAWVRSLGGLNTLRDAQSDLLRGAGLLLAFNADPQRGEFNPATDDRSTYKAFGSMYRNNSEDGPLPSKQRPTHKLLVAAQLTHTAGFVDTDQQRRANLLGMATSMYGRLISESGTETEAIVDAGEYAADIRFQLAMDDWLKSNKKPNQGLRDSAMAEMRAVMHERAAAFYDHSQKFKLEYTSSGALFERFIRLLLRDYILSNLDQDHRLSAVGVRTAFLHEDAAPFGVDLDPKPLFDIVMQRFSGDGSVATTPIQLKYGNGDGPKSIEGYLPGVVGLSVGYLSRGEMSIIADYWSRKYKDADRTDRSPRRLQALHAEVSEPLIAA